MRWLLSLAGFVGRDANNGDSRQHPGRLGDETVHDLIRLLPDGASAVAVIFVVMLFLKQQDRINAMLESITQDFNDKVFDSQKAFQDQILRLGRQQYENQKMYQDQIQSLIDAHINVSRETIVALKSLECSLREAKDRGHFKMGVGG